MNEYYMTCKILKSVVVSAENEEEAYDMMCTESGSQIYISGSFTCDKLGD